MVFGSEDWQEPAEEEDNKADPSNTYNCREAAETMLYKCSASKSKELPFAKNMCQFSAYNLIANQKPIRPKHRV